MNKDKGDYYKDGYRDGYGDGYKSCYSLHYDKIHYYNKRMETKTNTRCICMQPIIGCFPHKGYCTDAGCKNHAQRIKTDDDTK